MFRILRVLILLSILAGTFLLFDRNSEPIMIYFFNDNCESLGAKIESKQTASFGDISTHSFFYSHHIQFFLLV